VTRSLFLRTVLTVAVVFGTMWFTNWGYLSSYTPPCADMGMIACVAPRTPFLILAASSAVMGAAAWFFSERIGGIS
jgi:hypothetical protein